MTFGVAIRAAEGLVALADTRSFGVNSIQRRQSCR